MATTIVHKKSSVAGRIPLAADLEVGEIAINLVDKKLYTKQANGTVIELNSTPVNTSLASWGAGNEEDTGWTIAENGAGVMLFTNGITTVGQLDQSGNMRVVGDVRTNSTIGGEVIQQEPAIWSYNSALNNTLYFQYNQTNYMSLSAQGDLTIHGNLITDVSIGLGNATSFYFSNGSSAKLQIASNGDVSLAGDIDANVTF